MFKKKTPLNVRPEPPSFAEITEDINSADSNDVTFCPVNSGTNRTIVYRVVPKLGGCYLQCGEK